MKKKTIAACLIGTATAGAFFILNRAETPEPRSAEAAPAPLAAAAPAPAPAKSFATAERCDFVGGFAQSYAYSASVNAVISIQG